MATVPLNTRSRGGTGDVRRTLGVCEVLLQDRDDLVAKAMSWALRELIVHDQAAVEAFLDAHQDQLAARVKREAEAGNEVLVVVSAMAGETDRLVQLCKEASALADPKEYDVVVASGEQVTAGLLAMTLQNMGATSRSFMGWQLMRASGAHGNARVEKVESALLDEALSAGTICVIPGFQGVSEDGRVATLGRGGSDTSAVAIAAGVKADRCDIYTDVDGVYTTDPRIVAKAKKQKAVTYEEMLELASVGAKVLQTRSVGLAMKEKVRVQVLSSFIGEGAPPADDLPGTMIVSEAEMAATRTRGE